MYYTDHPYAYLPKLIEADIPIMLICGDSDTIVPYIENGKPLYDYYTANGGKITQIVKPGCDHHPHGLEDMTPLIEFTYENY
jgi:alpha-beta hydrolase superfamily lysophospholipase